LPNLFFINDKIGKKVNKDQKYFTISNPFSREKIRYMATKKFNWPKKRTIIISAVLYPFKSLSYQQQQKTWRRKKTQFYFAAKMHIHGKRGERNKGKINSTTVGGLI
jgi:hypothetical protein